MGLRRAPFSSFCAVLLVLLTVVPFTAPFQTCDLSTAAGEGPGQDVFSKEEASKEGAPLTPTTESIPLIHVMAFEQIARELTTQHPSVPPTVLRV
jgi:hypothetical protein